MAQTPATTINNPPNSWCHTKIDCSESHHVWVISNFSLCQENTGSSIQSAAFGTANGTQWTLKLYPNGCRDSYKDYISLFLTPLQKDGSFYNKLKFKFSVLNDKQEPIFKMPFTHWNPDDPIGAQDWGYSQFLRRKACSKYLVNDQLIISCHIIIYGNKVENSSMFTTTAGILPNFSVPECTLSHDLGSMFEDQKYGDTVLEVCGEQFLVSRQILQARSPIFAAMFEHEMEEQKKNRVIMSDVEPEIVKEMLTYIHTDTSPNIERMAIDLLPIADKYNLEGLKLMCEKAISTKINKENAIKILLLANLHNASRLKIFIINFIVQNGSHFLEASAWKKTVKLHLMEHPILVAEVTSALFASRL